MGNFVLDTFIEKIEIFSKNVFDILSNNEEYRNEEQLYHYTSFNAVQAIIKNKSFRASSIYTTNDPNDLHHGHKHICDWSRIWNSHAIYKWDKNLNAIL